MNQKAGNFRLTDCSRRNAGIALADFIYYLKKMMPHYQTLNRGSEIEWFGPHSEKIIHAMSVKTHRNKASLLINWRSLGIKASEYNLRGPDTIDCSEILIHKFPDPDDPNDSRDLSSKAVIETHLFSEIKDNVLVETGEVAICYGEGALPVMGNDRWFAKAFNNLEPTFRSIEALLSANERSQKLSIINVACGLVKDKSEKVWHFSNLLDLIEEYWSISIAHKINRSKLNGNNTLNVELLSEGLPNVEMGQRFEITSPEDLDKNRREIARRFAASLFFFLARYCGIGREPLSIQEALDQLRRDDSKEEDWSEAVIIIEDGNEREDKYKHTAAVVYPGYPIGDTSGHIIPIATLFSSLNDSMTIYPEMNLKELRKKMILWIVALNRTHSVEWDKFLDDYPYMATVVQGISSMTDLVKRAGDNFDIMDSGEISEITLATQSHRLVWGYSEGSQIRTDEGQELHTFLPSPAPFLASGLEERASHYTAFERYIEPDNSSSMQAGDPARGPEDAPVSYTAFEHYVPGRDI